MAKLLITVCIIFVIFRCVGSTFALSLHGGLHSKVTVATSHLTLRRNHDRACASGMLVTYYLKSNTRDIDE